MKNIETTTEIFAEAVTIISQLNEKLNKVTARIEKLKEDIEEDVRAMKDDGDDDFIYNEDLKMLEKAVAEKEKIESMIDLINFTKTCLS